MGWQPSQHGMAARRFPQGLGTNCEEPGPTSLKSFALTTSEVIGSLPLSSINFDLSPLFNAERSGKPLQFSEPQSKGW